MIPEGVARAQGGGWGGPPPAPPPGGFGSPGGFSPAPPGSFGPAGRSSPPGGPKPITGSPQTMALHAMSIDPKTGLPRGEKPPASSAAVVSLICGILLCLGPITGFPAIVAGIVARSQVRQDPMNVGGGTMALVGIVLGVLNVLSTGAAVVIWVLSQLL